MSRTSLINTYNTCKLFLLPGRHYYFDGEITFVLELGYSDETARMIEKRCNEIGWILNKEFGICSGGSPTSGEKLN